MNGYALYVNGTLVGVHALVEHAHASQDYFEEEYPGCTVDVVPVVAVVYPDESEPAAIDEQALMCRGKQDVFRAH